MVRVRQNVIPELDDRNEWDFTLVPSNEIRACCLFEYGRESRAIRRIIEHPPKVEEVIAEFLNENQGKQARTYANHFNILLLRSLPYPQMLDCAWLLKPKPWKAEFCKNYAKFSRTLLHARHLEATLDQAFFVGMSQFFKPEWTEQHTRLLDMKNGLETILGTIDWQNFTDAEIIEGFSQWVKSAQAGLTHQKECLIFECTK